MHQVLLFVLAVLILGTQGFKCRALALGGGGDRGAYEAGVLQALSQFEKEENLKYDVISGISAGAINAGILASYPKGQEKIGIRQVVQFNLGLKSSDVYSNWFPGGILQGFLFKSGLYDTSAMEKSIKKNVNAERIKKNGRSFITGAHSLSDAKFIQFNETHSASDLLKAIYASAAIPSIFPAVKIGEKYFIDGGVSYMNPVSKAIRTCLTLGATEVHADVVLAIGDLFPVPRWISRTTPFVLGKTLFGVVSNFFLRDLQHARTSFPKAVIRSFIPSKSLPGYDIGFSHSKELFSIGYEDAKKIIQQ